MKGEIWKPVRNYEGLYEVSNMGRVKSLNYNNTGKEGIMKPQKDRGGYLQVGLSKEGERKFYSVHILVGQVFCDNPMGYTEVNHKDEDKTNNCVENLEWCSRSYNINYGIGNKRRAEKLSKPVYSINKESGLITYWESIMEASRQTGINHGNITLCCQGKRKSVGNHYWFYADDDDNE